MMEKLQESEKGLTQQVVSCWYRGPITSVRGEVLNVFVGRIGEGSDTVAEGHG